MWWTARTRRRRTTIRIAVAVGLCALIIVVYRTHANLYTTLLRTGIIPSYTERVYTIGTGTSPIVYVPIGDSLTAGVGAGSYTHAYPYLLATRLYTRDARPLTLKPHAKPGATTGEAVTRLLDEAVASNPDIVTVLLGVNDVHKGTTPDVFTYTYEYILKRLTHETHARVYIIAIPYIGSPEIISPTDRTYLDARTQAFNAILRTLGDAYHLPYIDLYTPTAARAHTEGRGYYARDLFHPSADGYAAWSNILYDHLD